jgi:hypothetical protein
VYWARSIPILVEARIVDGFGFQDFSIVIPQPTKLVLLRMYRFFGEAWDEKGFRSEHDDAMTILKSRFLDEKEDNCAWGFF